MNQIQKHQKTCQKLTAIYQQKNNAYGDSFRETYKKLGVISAVTRITDKVNRLQALATNPDIDKGDESLLDTCLDLANYAIMTAMELEDGHRTS